MDSLADMIAADAATLERVAPEDVVRKLTEGVAELADIQNRIEEAEAALQVLSDRRTELKIKVLPDLMDRAQTDAWGVPGQMVDVVLRPVYYASIRADWGPVERQAAFAYLEQQGAGDLVKTIVSVSFGRGELTDAHDLVNHIKRWNPLGDRPVDLSMSAHHSSLTSWLKAEMGMNDRSEPVNMDVIGGRVTRTCDLKKRPNKKGKK